MISAKTDNTDSRTLATGFADGHVIHNRLMPKKHRFKYNMYWCLFDVDRIDQWMAQSRLWRYNGIALLSLHDKDYITDSNDPIKDKIRAYIKQQSRHDFSGQIFLFTHPRFLGYGFNSVNFYFCFDGGLRYVVSEINNTPWGEKHLYFHDCSQAKCGADGDLQFNFQKQFHISPFAPMDMAYQWHFKVTAQGIFIKMMLHRKGVNVLNVVLDTKITPVVENNINRFPLMRPFQPWKMSLGIYWQAFKLWFKKVPFYSHPNNNKHE